MKDKIRFFFTFTGETPAKKNSRRILRSGKTIPSRRFELWHNENLFYLFRQKCPVKPLTEPLFIKMIFTHGDKTRRDSDNEATSILDLLQDGNVIADDNWQIVRKISIENRYEKNNPHCDIMIFDYREKEV